MYGHHVCALVNPYFKLWYMDIHIQLRPELFLARITHYTGTCIQVVAEPIL